MSLIKEAGAVVGPASRQVDHALTAAQDQIAQLLAIVRRVEAVADRVTGTTAPTMPDPSPPAMPLPGLMGSLQDLHTLRDLVGGALATAVARIEEVI